MEQRKGENFVRSHPLACYNIYLSCTFYIQLFSREYSKAARLSSINSALPAFLLRHFFAPFASSIKP